ncbi:RidA family protein [Belnapia rosea]|uniref:Enamine deaminase RidA, house cleaning of reactive enamine intermediates, YjgF/YER057c/UK114 family n=1 Tax=Belnapia rosea TaxID=938405 RepID=A0A1G6LPC6_9PROT|nr:RidA family protein [Belnapia rosea]SDB46751.1 Enamine deaminase RidA, house cleaning of reactive enamine intermediates, YjgF/YER057c/UK114 family [Belnapia rosea]SDC45029.1 Enamine deaminase RidA, house cleaning of reactive enamine intermediates, YjgF/YER057c/UK114 family [Belnapia rosea]
MSLATLQPPGWPQPKGYANGMAGRGRTVLIGGQIGWDAEGRFAEGFIGQVEQALRNILAVLAEAGGGPEHIGRLTWYVTDMAEYRDSLRALGPAYRAVMGRHFPAMTLVQVLALVEPEARVEIEATAIIPD